MGAEGWPFWVFIAVLIVLNFALSLGLGLGPAAPDLLVPAVLLGARRLSAGWAAVLGFGAGILQDSLALIGFGASAVLLTVLGFLGARSRDLFYGESLLFIALYLFVGKWVFDVTRYFVVGSVGAGDVVRELLVQAPLAAVYSAASALVALVAFRLVFGDR
jgi:rod shape-determining protein MreD